MNLDFFGLSFMRSMLRACRVEPPRASGNRCNHTGIYCNIRDMKKADLRPADFDILVYYQSGGRGRTRTYEGIASGFTVRPLCRSGHSPPKPSHRIDPIRKTASRRPVGMPFFL